MYSPNAHISQWNEGARQTQSPRAGQSVYEQTFPGKMASLAQIAKAMNGETSVNPDSSHPRLRGWHGPHEVNARCNWNNAEVIALELKDISVEQAIAALKAIGGAQCN